MSVKCTLLSSWDISIYFEIEISIHQIGSKTDQETKQTVDGNPI